MKLYQSVVCYKTHDGKIFEDFEKAQAHSEDNLGQVLDNMLKSFGVETRTGSMFKVILSMVAEKEKLKTHIELISNILNYADNQELIEEE